MKVIAESPMRQKECLVVVTSNHKANKVEKWRLSR
jgi:hypothetical protein